MGLAPDPQFPERGNYNYDDTMGPNRAGDRGPLRFEEGLATDTDLPSSFQRGMLEPMIPAPGRINHVNPDIQFKMPEETMAQRAHVGSAAWIDAPTMLGEFAHGSFTDAAEVTYEEVVRNGRIQKRRAPEVVTD
jgi:hypothetical protein